MRWTTTTLVAIAFTVHAITHPVVVYEDVNFGGTSYYSDLQNFTTLNGELISSIKVQPGYVFVGYAEELERVPATPNKYYYMTWDSDAPYLGSLWNKKIVAFEVQRASAAVPRSGVFLGAAMLFTKSSYAGTIFPANVVARFTLAATISSIKVTPGYSVALTAPSGATTSFTVDSPTLGSWAGTSRILTVTKLDASAAATSTPSTTAATLATSSPAASALASIAPASKTVPPPSTPSTTDYTIVIIGCSAGVVVAVLFAVFCVVQSKKHKKTPATSNILTEPFISTNPKPNPDSGLINLSGLYKVRLDQAMLHLDCVLGYGSFAAVSKGSYNGIPVAVKQLQSSRRSNADIQSFVDEIELMSRFNSAHIIKLIGAAWTTPMDLCAVMELMDQGDLKDYLDAHDASVYTWAMKLEALRGIVDGLTYLHSLNIVHRDLKSRNVLLDSVKGVKIVDFGVAKEDIQGTMTMGVGTFRWMAPEVLLESAYSVAADIYSFGMLLSEFDSHHIPYQDLTNPTTGKPLADPAIIGGVLNGSIKPTFSETCPVWVKTLADACLQFNANDRPTIYDVAATLAKVQVA